MNKEKEIQIETALAHQEQQIADLNELVHQQWQEIERLKSHLKLTQNKIHDLEGKFEETSRSEGQTVSEMAAAEKPPHY